MDGDIIGTDVIYIFVIIFAIFISLVIGTLVASPLEATIPVTNVTERPGSTMWFFGLILIMFSFIAGLIWVVKSGVGE